MDQAVVTTDKKGYTGIINFFNPKGNALNSVVLEGLRSAVDSMSQDNSIRVIVLRSSGEGAFCAGADLMELKSLSTEEKAVEFFSKVARLIVSIVESPKPVICRVQGKAVGGAVGVIAACDYVLASDQASIRLAELEIGLAPFVIGPVVERKTGSAALKYMSLDTAWRDAVWAERNGLFTVVFGNDHSLDLETESISMKFAAYNPESVSKWKQALNEDCFNWKTTLLERAKLSGGVAAKAMAD